MEKCSYIHRRRSKVIIYVLPEKSSEACQRVVTRNEKGRRRRRVIERPHQRRVRVRFIAQSQFDLRLFARGIFATLLQRIKQFVSNLVNQWNMLSQHMCNLQRRVTAQIKKAISEQTCYLKYCRVQREEEKSLRAIPHYLLATACSAVVPKEHSGRFTVQGSRFTVSGDEGLRAGFDDESAHRVFVSSHVGSISGLCGGEDEEGWGGRLGDRLLGLW